MNVSFSEYVGDQLEDMTQTFRSKAQQFAQQLVGEVLSARNGVEPSVTTGEPPKFGQVPDHSQLDEGTEPQAYRDESRVSEYGELIETN